MLKNKIKIQVKWEVKFKKPVYSCSISNILGDDLPEIIGCSFDETMRIYNLQGKQIMVSEFSSKITTFLVAPITNDKNVEILSGDVNGINKVGGFVGYNSGYILNSYYPIPHVPKTPRIETAASGVTAPSRI